MRRSDDWETGLSFSTSPPSAPHYKYDVAKLTVAGYSLKFDGGTQYTGLFGRPLSANLAGRVAGSGHVSVYLSSQSSWDEWLNDETTVNLPGIPWSQYTPTAWSQALYALKE